MRSLLSALVIAASFTLLVPDNGAQAVNAAESIGASAASSNAAHVAGASVQDRADGHEAPFDSDVAMLLALGFLGAVMARRLRAD